MYYTTTTTTNNNNNNNNNDNNNNNNNNNNNKKLSISVFIRFRISNFGQIKMIFLGDENFKKLLYNTFKCL